MRLIATLLVFCLCGCRPSDQKVLSVRSRVLSGNRVDFTQEGYSLCGKKSYSRLDLFDDNERERIVLGRQFSIVRPGHNNCYRVGDTVDLNPFGKHLRQGGQVRIERLSLILLDKIRAKNDLNGEFFTKTADSTQYLSAVQSQLKADQEGIVTIVTVTYVNGSAFDEERIRAANGANHE